MLLKKRKFYNLQTYGANSLKGISEEITTFDSELKDLASTMVRVMHDLNGIGLAAVQIGIMKRLIVLDVGPQSMGNPPTPGELQLSGQMPIALVNPEIVEFSGEIVPYDEGCLSVPEVYATVMRHRLVKVSAYDLSGNKLEFEAGGLLGRCIQHEVDHLNGKLFVDRLTPEVKSTVENELAALYRRGKRTDFQRKLTV